MKRQILLFGAGKSATVLIDYLLHEAEQMNWLVKVADAQLEVIEQKLAGRPHAEAVSLDINHSDRRRELIQSTDLVISMMPPALHILIARDCLDFGKHLLTASYVDESIRALDAEVRDKGLLFLCEMGLDPGIDHMSAMKLIHEIHADGGTITSFKSHCGGLVAPESDDNPWHYKISWNPRNVVLAGKAGAVYLENNKQVNKRYESLFQDSGKVSINQPIPLSLGYYPNRNSLGYIETYQLHQVNTFVRTTLRYPEFMSGWNHVIQLKLTDEEVAYATDEMTLMQFFEVHLKRHGLENWMDEYLQKNFLQANHVIDAVLAQLQELSASDENLQRKNALIQRAQKMMASNLHEANLMLQQLLYLGMKDNRTLINKGHCSAADVLQFILENKWVLKSGEKDMVVMLHEIGFVKDGQDFEVKSSLVVIGKDHLRTAMAMTVGLPLGISAKLILQDKIKQRGVMIPTHPEIYLPVLEALQEHGVSFIENYQSANK